MDLERKRRISVILDEALAAEPDERAALLDQRCAGDDSLRAEVESLLAEAADTTGFLEDSPSAGLRAPTRARDAGERVGHYRLIERIGAGGMGEVWLADRDDAEFSMRVAIKFVRRDFDTSAIEARFKAERQVLAGLTHPNIARLLDGGATDDEAPYLVMEHVEGVPIDEYCDAHRMTVRERLALFRKVCDAVQHAHANLVVHRDLKPGNILVTSDGQPKLLDFGIAKVLGEADAPAQPSMTFTGQRLLTPRYASPEQVRAEPVTTATDVYSLGVVLYELLAGESPYNHTDNARELESEICERNPSRPSTKLSPSGQASGPTTHDTRELASLRSTDPQKLARTLRGELDDIILMAMRKEPERRYASVGALRDDIDRHLQGQPVQARPDTLGYRTRKFVHRNRLAVAAGALLLLALVAGVVGTSVGLVRALEAEAVAQQERDTAQAQQALAEAAEARAEAEAEEARRQAAIAQAVNDFLNDDLLAAVAPSVQAGRGREVAMRDVLDEASRRLTEDQSDRFADEPVIEAAVRMTLGRTYDSLGEIDSAAPHLQRALALRTTALGADHPDTLDSAVYLGVNRTSQGELDDADAILRGARERSLTALGPHDPIALNAGMQHGDALRQLGRYDEAEALMRSVVDAAAESDDASDIFRLQAMNNLAIILEQQSRYEESEPLLRQILEDKRALLGDDDPSTIVSINNLGLNRLNFGAYDEAVALFEECVEASGRVQGDDHPGTISALQNLATTYDYLGRTDEAREQFDVALARAVDLYGQEHPDTLFIKHNLGFLLMRTGDVEQAETLLQQAVDGRTRTLGPDAPETNQSINILGRLYLSEGDIQRAEPLILQALDWSKTNLGPAHNDTLAYMNTLGSMYFSQERYEDALPVYEETVAILREAMPEGFIGTGVTLAGLGRTHARLEQWTKARECLAEAYDILAALFGPEHARVQSVVEEMIAACEASGDETAANQWRARRTDDDAGP